MAATSAWTPSHRLRGAAKAEGTRLHRELSRLDARRDHLVHELATLDASRQELALQLRALRRLVQEGDASGTTQETAPGQTSNGYVKAADANRALKGTSPVDVDNDGHVLLRGSQIREVAVQVLASSPEGTAPMHYRDWYALLFRRGFLVGGQSPYATFLTQVSRSPVAHRTDQPGTYRIEYDAPSRLRRELDVLRRALDAVHRGRAEDSADLERFELRRYEIVTTTERKRKELAEALRSLGEPETPVIAEAPSDN